VARLLIARKIRGQIANLDHLGADTGRARTAAETVKAAESLDQIRLAESMAAEGYWNGWRNLRVSFATADGARVPPHWLRFEFRTSPLTGGPRVAVDPINCLINYVARLLEAETRIACLALGLDDTLGIIHLDTPGRSSLVFDLVEPARPEVERWVIDLVEQHTFSRRDFEELPSGACRAMSPLRDALAATGARWRHAVAPHVEDAVWIIAEGAGLPAPATLLTNSTRRSARPSTQRARRPAAPRTPRPPAVCTNCGGPTIGTRLYCTDCHRAANEQRLHALRLAEIERRDSSGDHPSRRPEVRAQIAATQRLHHASRQGLTTGFGFTGRPSEFRRLILPRLQSATTADLARVTGLSRGYCAQVRNGTRVPNVRHWAAFQLAGLHAPGHASAKTVGSGRHQWRPPALGSHGSRGGGGARGGR
jgi:hypothetical protein